MNVGLLIRKPASVFQRWAVGLQTQLTRRGHEWENLPLHQNRKMSQNPTWALHILDSIQPQETQKEIYRNFIEFEANYRSNGTYSPEIIPCEAQKVWKLESNIGYSSSRAFNGAISFLLSPFCNAVVSSSNSVGAFSLSFWACFLPSCALAVAWVMVAARFLVIWIVLIDWPRFGLTRPNLVVMVWFCYFCTLFVFSSFWIEKCLSFQFCIHKMEVFDQIIV